MAPIDVALADLRSQEQPNIKSTARKYNVAYSTLRDRFKKDTTSVQDFHRNVQANLKEAEELALCIYINKLSDRGLPPIY